MKRITVIFIAMILFTLASYAMAVPVAAPTKAPDFNCETISGESVSLADIVGKKLLIIDIWAPWCPPCREEMPILQKAFEKHKGILDIIAVTPEKDLAQINEFVNLHGLTYDIVVDGDCEMLNQFPTDSLPTLYFVNSDGYIVNKIVGYETTLMETVAKFVESYPVPEISIPEKTEPVVIDGKKIREKADRMLTENQLQDAIDLYSKAIISGEKEADVFVKRGTAYRKNRMVDEAIADFQRALTIDSRNEQACFALAEMYFRLGDSDAAKLYYTQLIDISPISSNYYSRAMFHYYEERYEEALADIDEAIELDPVLEIAKNYRPLIMGNITGSKVQAPDFTVKTINGDELTLSSFKGNKSVILDQWASWCPPCREEMPELQKFYEKYSTDVEIIAASRDKELKPAMDFINEKGVTFKVVHDADGTIKTLYPSDFIPTLVIINKDGEIIKTFIGYDEKLIEKLIVLLGLVSDEESPSEE